MHSWHTGDAARMRPNSLGVEKFDSLIPATKPDASIGNSTRFGSCLRSKLGIVTRIFSRYAPTASNFSRPNPIGSIRLWHDAQLGLDRCTLSSSRLVIGLSGDCTGRFVLTPGGG